MLHITITYRGGGGDRCAYEEEAAHRLGTAAPRVTQRSAIRVATGGAERLWGGQRVWWQQLWSFQRDREKPKAPVRPAKPRELDLCCSLVSYTTLARRCNLARDYSTARLNGDVQAPA